jgi:hypothetical protein
MTRLVIYILCWNGAPVFFSRRKKIPTRVSTSSYALDFELIVVQRLELVPRPNAAERYNFPLPAK